MSELVKTVFDWIDVLVLERIDKIISVIIILFAVVSLLRPFIRWMRHPVVVHTILGFLTLAVCVFATVVMTQSGWSTLWDEPAAQFALSVLIIVPLLAVLGWRRDRRVVALKKERVSQEAESERLKGELSQFSTEVAERDAKIDALRDEVHGKEVEAVRLAGQVHEKERQLSESLGRAQSREAQLARVASCLSERDSTLLKLGDDLRAKDAELAECNAALHTQENEFLRIKADLDRKNEALQRDLQQKENEHAIVPFRRVDTPFVSIINLKGGVGKTTLTANLAATLSLEDGLKILVVDLDFQGTLSEMAVDPALLSREKNRENTVCHLLAPDFDFARLGQLWVPMCATPRTEGLEVHVIVADDRLEMEDFRAQMRFLRDRKHDVRFLFRAALRRPEIAKQYDLVIFDCPPRFTTSAVNALACSDYFLIPSKLDPKSVNAVPRTLKWIANLRAIAQPELLGVIANEVGVGQHLAAQEKIVYGTLRNTAETEYGREAYVFTRWVKRDRDIAQGNRPGIVPALNARVRKLFKPVAKEFKERLGL